MDVSLSGWRIFLGCLAALALAFGLISCGNRYDLNNEYGRRARIDDANHHLSQGNCTAAAEAIDPLYFSPHADDEVRLVKSSVYACLARFQLITFIARIADGGSIFVGLAKALDNSTGDPARSNMLSATDVLTLHGARLSAHERPTNVNAYLVFLSLGAVSAIIRNYGAPDSSGNKGTDLIYDGMAGAAVGEMSDTDACALGAAFSTISNSFPFSGLTDSTTSDAVSNIDNVCVAAGLSSCAELTRERNACDGGDTDAAVLAASVVAAVNAGW